VSDLARNVGRIIACDNCLYEWVDAGAEDVMDTFRYQSGRLYDHMRGKAIRTR
jgi:hypothetical protein